MPSSYPSGLDALQRVAAGDSMQSTSHSGLHNSQSDAIEAIQAVLGLNPQGGSATVAARCAALESGKASLNSSPVFTGTVEASGLAGSLLSSASPVMNGVAAAGTGVVPSRQDHVHPTDTSRAAASHAARHAADGSDPLSIAVSQVDGLATDLTRGPSGVAVGRWSNQLCGASSYSQTGLTDNSGRMVVWPTWNPLAMTISDLTIRVMSATGATGVARMGFYAMDGVHGVPGTLIADCGTVATTSSGIKSITGLSAVLPAGRIGVAIAFQDVASQGSYQGAYGVSCWGSYEDGTQTNWAYVQSGVTGALPATMTPAAYAAYTLPFLLIKRSA